MDTNLTTTRSECEWKHSGPCLWFDYGRQAWVEHGAYLDCGHRPADSVMGPMSPNPGGIFQGCDCYGRAHAGELAEAERFRAFAS